MKPSVQSKPLPGPPAWLLQGQTLLESLGLLAGYGMSPFAAFPSRESREDLQHHVCLPEELVIRLLVCSLLDGQGIAHFNKEVREAL